MRTNSVFGILCTTGLYNKELTHFDHHEAFQDHQCNLYFTGRLGGDELCAICRGSGEVGGRPVPCHSLSLYSHTGTCG